MKRLTFYDDFNEPCYRLGNIVYSNKIAARLASYEDTGLEPEEIRMIQQIKEFDDAHQFSPVDEELEEKCVTNADSIRQMSDEELADFIGGIFTLDSDVWGDYDPRTVVMQEPRVEVRNKEEMLEWLKQEVESDA